MIVRIALPALGLLLALPALAQDHSAHAAEPGTPATAAYIAANAAMHQGMAIDFSGNPDVDFVLTAPPNLNHSKQPLATLGHGPLSEEDLSLRCDFGDLVRATNKRFVGGYAAWQTIRSALRIV